jgi:hypothetical protein
MDNFSYYSRQKDKPSSGYEVKKEIVAGLEKREIMCDNTEEIHRQLSCRSELIKRGSV